MFLFSSSKNASETTQPNDEEDSKKEQEMMDFQELNAKERPMEQKGSEPHDLPAPSPQVGEGGETPSSWISQVSTDAMGYLGKFMSKEQTPTEENPPDLEENQKFYELMDDSPALLGEPDAGPPEPEDIEVDDEMINFYASSSPSSTSTAPPSLTKINLSVPQLEPQPDGTSSSSQPTFGSFVELKRPEEDDDQVVNKDEGSGATRWFSEVSNETIGYTLGSVTRLVTGKRDGAPTNISSYQLTEGAVFDPRAKPQAPSEKNTSSTTAIETIQSDRCSKCQTSFGITCFRYICSYCHQNFCDRDLPFQDYIFSRNVTTEGTLERVCTDCHFILQELALRKRIAWRLCRIEAFLSRKLIPITEEREDTLKMKALRAFVLSVKAAKHLPIGWTINAVASGVDFFIANGAVTWDALMMSSQLTEAVSSIMGAAGSPKNVDLHDVVRGLYYTLALHRWQRGVSPASQEIQHRDAKRVPLRDVRQLLYYSTFAIHFAYLKEPLDLQRLLAQQGFGLIAMELKSEIPEFPSYFLCASHQRKEVILAIRGTASVNDFGTDVSATPTNYPRTGSAMAHGGIARATYYLFDELRECLYEFHRTGFRLVLTGHSLGAGCASLLAMIIRDYIPSVQAYGFGCPSCVELDLTDKFNDFVVNVVNGDDVVPRLNVPRSRVLLQDLVNYKSSWKSMFSEDTISTKTRVQSVWKPNYRTESLPILEPSGYSIKTEENQLIISAGDDEITVERKEVPDGDLQGPMMEESTKRGVEWIQHALLPSPGDLGEEDESGENLSSSEPLEPNHVKSIPLYVPGRIYHMVVSKKGIKEMTEIGPEHPSLESIQVYENMISDHLGLKYQEGLEKVVYAAMSSALPKEFQAYDTTDVCEICAMDFTWNSTCHSAAQQSLDRKNCRKCGRLVCSPCSSKRRPLLKLGHPYPVRLCDACYYNPVADSL
mmetsp:Transcript_32707/g.44927  ORF Transcript_32707/g.44927 Transcript_32707/m.44927 type:complete len:942 (+) Transcript_32707:107-2932(+)